MSMIDKSPFVGSLVSVRAERTYFYTIVILGIMAIGSVLYWRHYEILAIETGLYEPVSAPKTKAVEMKSQNYKLDTFEVSPTVK